MDDLLKPSEPIAYGDRKLQGQEGGARHLSSLLPALSSALGSPVRTAVHPDPRSLQEALHLPDAGSVLVVLADGLGFWNLAGRLGHAPYLRSLMNEGVNAVPISTCLPSTTAVAMGVFGTGTCPGLTGLTGYTQLNPEKDEICQQIQFRNAIEPTRLQTQPTIFETLVSMGVRVTSVGEPKFKDSALTRACLRGSEYKAGRDLRQRVMTAAQSSREPGLTYLYLPEVDKVGHHLGWTGDAWVAALEEVDAGLSLLRRNLPKGTLVVITADHGMVQALPEERIDIRQRPDLMDGVRLVGGEPRAVMLYAQDGVDPEDMAGRWRQGLENRAVIMTKGEAVAAGVFGSVDERVLPMIGDVLVAACGQVTLVDSGTQKDAATRLPGVHGSRTILETRIPCLIDLV